MLTLFIVLPDLHNVFYSAMFLASSAQGTYLFFKRKLLIFSNIDMYHFYLCTAHFEIYIVQSTKNALFINLVKSFKFTLKYTIISLLHVSVFYDHHQGALSVPN